MTSLPALRARCHHGTWAVNAMTVQLSARVLHFFPCSFPSAVVAVVGDKFCDTTFVLLSWRQWKGEEEEEGEGGRRESGANEERHYTAAVKTLVEYIYSSRLRLRGRARSEAAGGRQPTARDCVLLVRGRRRSYFSLFMRVSQRVKGVVIPNGGRGRKGADWEGEEQRGKGEWAKRSIIWNQTNLISYSEVLTMGKREVRKARD